MTRRFFAAALTALTALASTPALAEWSEPAVPNAVYAGYTDGSIFISGLPNVEGCTSSTVKVTRDPQGVQSLALAAFLSGNKNTSKCAGDYQVAYQCKIVK